MHIGLLPIPDQYYQPLINPRKYLRKKLDDERNLPGIDFNVDEQLRLLSNFNYNNELIEFPLSQSETERVYLYNNDSYMSGDAEYLYSMVRFFRPRKIIEIGSGYSTLMVRNAVVKNKLDDINYSCDHICIEPYEQHWLEELDINIIRNKVEELDVSLFKSLQSGDFLFIDSSHVIRPQGDVLFEYNEILPLLNKGVIVHIHDIFTPRDYPEEWLCDRHLLWNEQYLLESFLSFNGSYKIIGMLNYLANNYSQDFKAKSPVYSSQSNRKPGAFWIQKIK